MSTSGRILRNTGYLYAKMAITMFVSLYTTRLILGSLGASDFGIFNIVGGAIGMLGFLNAAMASATQRFMSYAEGEGNYHKKKAIFNVSLILNGIIAVIVVILLLLAALFFFNGILNIERERMFAAEIVYLCFVISTMLTILNVPYDAVMNSHENMLYFSIVGIIESILKLMVAFACVYTTYDKLIVYGVLMAFIPLITLTIMKIYCHRNYEECVISPKSYFDRRLLNEMTHFAGWNFLGSFSALVCGHGSNIVLNHFYGTTLNAANGVSGQLNGQLQVFGNTLLKALNPVLVKSEGHHDRGTMFKYAFTGAKLTVCMFAFFAIPVVIDRDFILQIWLKEVPPYTSVFMKYLIIWTFFSQIAGTLYTSIAAIGDIKRVSQWNSIVLFSGLILLYIIFSLGADPEYFMVISCLTGAGQTINFIYYSKKNGGMNLRLFLYDVFVRVAVGIGITYAFISMIWSVLEPGYLRLCLVLFTSVVSYALVFYALTLNYNERNLINYYIKRFVRKIVHEKI